jgi:hypothetical protein
MDKQLTLGTIINELELSPQNEAQIAEVLKHDDSSTPWFISGLIVISAWLSVLFLVLFFAIFLREETDWLIPIGLILIVATVYLQLVKTETNSFFLNQLVLPFNLTGQIFFIVGIVIEVNLETAASATVLMELGVCAIYRDAIMRFLAVLIATLAILLLCYEFQIYEAIHILIVLMAATAIWYWITEAKHLSNEIMVELYEPLRYGFVIALQLLLLLSILPHSRWILPITWWFSSLGLTVLLLALEYYLLQKNLVSFPKRYAIFAGTILTGLLLYQAPGIIAAIILILLAFQRGNRVLMGIAIIFLTIFFVAYYYHLNITLLMKSISLMSAGVSLLVLRFISEQVFKGEQR